MINITVGAVPSMEAAKRIVDLLADTFMETADAEGVAMTASIVTSDDGEGAA